MKENGLSRRSFLKGAALVGASAAAVGLVACDAQAQDKQGEAGSVATFSWDQEADIVVVGLGCAGAAAAIEAATEGASVIVLEKMSEDQAGGDTSCNGGYMIPSCYQAENMVNYSFGEMDLTWAKSIQEEAEKIPEWLLENANVEYDMETETMMHIPGSGPTVYLAITNALSEFDFPILYETSGKKLIIDSATGAVRGVEAEQGSNTIRVRANKAVILTTGSYTANIDLMRELHLPGMNFVSTGAPANTGDGLIMGLSVGAAPMMLGKGVDWDAVAFKKASEEMGTGIAVSARSAGVIVNMAGKRFMNESMSITHNKGDLPFLSYDGAFPVYEGYRNLPFWEVWDDTVIKTAPLGNHIQEECPSNGWTWATAHKVLDWSQNNEAEIAKGWIIKADTIEELATKMSTKTYMGQDIHMDAKVLAETVDTYNGYCETGADSEFFKPAAALKLLATPPFYAAELVPSIMYTIGGLKINANGQTLAYDGQPIARLYSAGNVGQGVQLSPDSIPACMACGKIAARHALALGAW
jgi:succinate dehydrogenase/fumarate reductase flavoprotein subunit